MSYTESTTEIDEKRQHNSQLPVSRIPNEVLARIFHFLVPGEMIAREYLPNWNHKIRLSITHVCHRWREVALGFSLLWCDIDNLTTGFRNSIPELLRRSQGSPCLTFVGPLLQMGRLG